MSRPASRRPGAIVIALTAVLAIAACGPAAVPSGPLTGCGDDRADAMSIGGFPELEALIPRTLGGRAPDLVNSGRSCSERALGSLATHGITELRYAGATWNEGTSDATVFAVLATPTDRPAVQQAWIEEFYTAGAVAGTKTDNVTTTRPTMEPVGQVFRLEALNDLSQQTVVTWSGGPGVAFVVIVVSEVGPDASRAEHDARVAAAVALASAPTSPSSAPPPASTAPGAS